eukprot:8417590-Pyramimonas_sp.AAC.1
MKARKRGSIRNGFLRPSARQLRRFHGPPPATASLAPTPAQSSPPPPLPPPWMSDRQCSMDT